MNYKNELFTDVSIGIEHNRPTPLSLCCKASKSESETTLLENTVVENYFFSILDISAYISLQLKGHFTKRVRISSKKIK